jgi:hypothetical protein
VVPARRVSCTLQHPSKGIPGPTISWSLDRTSRASGMASEKPGSHSTRFLSLGPLESADIRRENLGILNICVSALLRHVTPLLLASLNVCLLSG